MDIKEKYPIGARVRITFPSRINTYGTIVGYLKPHRFTEPAYIKVKRDSFKTITIYAPKFVELIDKEKENG